MSTTALRIPAPRDQWFVVQVLSGQEKKVYDSIIKRLKTEEMGDLIFNVLIPTERVQEIKQGKKSETTRKFFPGYIIANMHLLTEDGVMRVLHSPVTYTLIATAVVATLLQQSAFHAGSLKASVPAMLVLEPLVAVFLGQVILGEHLTVSTPSAVALAIATGAMAVATVALGRDEGAFEDELEAAAARRLEP